MHKRIIIKSNKLNYYADIGSNHLFSFPKNSFILADSNLFKHNYFKRLKNIKNINLIKIKVSEKAKEFNEISKVIDKLIKLGIKKKSTLYVIGGGILQDIGGFVSSILFRGIKWKFIPTTLLSQGDSCIGSKTSINFRNYKNQIGTFYPPTQIKVNFKFLESLKQNDILSGLGEMSHYLIIGGNKSFKIIEKELTKKKINYKNIVFESLKIKKIYIEKDEFDQNIRNILNYGHTFGHAIESATNYKVPHGIAVAMGIDISNFFSSKYNLMKNNERLRIQKTLLKIFYSIDVSKININNIIKAIKNDKKTNKDYINLIICIKLGRMKIRKVKIDFYFKKILESYFDNLPC